MEVEKNPVLYTAVSSADPHAANAFTKNEIKSSSEIATMMTRRFFGWIVLNFSSAECQQRIKETNDTDIQYQNEQIELERSKYKSVDDP